MLEGALDKTAHYVTGMMMLVCSRDMYEQEYDTAENVDLT